MCAPSAPPHTAFQETLAIHIFLEIPCFPCTFTFATSEAHQQKEKVEEDIMPPRSVCLNVFTSSLGDSSAAVRDDGVAGAMGMLNGGMERRDSAQSGMLDHLASSNSIAF